MAELDAPYMPHVTLRKLESLPDQQISQSTSFCICTLSIIQSSSERLTLDRRPRHDDLESCDAGGSSSGGGAYQIARGTTKLLGSEAGGGASCQRDPYPSSWANAVDRCAVCVAECPETQAPEPVCALPIGS